MNNRTEITSSAESFRLIVRHESKHLRRCWNANSDQAAIDNQLVTVVVSSNGAEVGLWLIADTGAWLGNSLHCALPIRWGFTARISKAESMMPMGTERAEACG